MNKEQILKEYKTVIIAAAALAVIAILFILNALMSDKSISIKAPTELLALKVGESYTIKWSSKNVGSVGIALYKGDKAQWIAQGISAGKGSFDWKPFVYQAPGADYRLAVFEYPWKKGNAIAYSRWPLEIVGPRYASCDTLSIENQWPFIPSDYPQLHRVFITTKAWNGNLGGLDGADAKCQNEAGELGYSGTFIALIGTDAVSAKERITKNGTFVDSNPEIQLAEGRTCNRLIANSVDTLLDKSLLTKEQAAAQLGFNFGKRISDAWFGRKTPVSKQSCLELPFLGQTSAFSWTSTCQDWKQGKREVYSGSVPLEADLPKCYNQAGKNVPANYYGANASGLDANGNLIMTASTCDQEYRLVCVEQ